MPTIKDDTISDACFEGFTQLIHKLTGITIKQERQTMIVGRLRRRVIALNLDTFEDYLEYVRNHKDEHEHFVNQITTNETYFFRTPRVWEYIDQTYLPEWRKRNASAQLNVWSAASSTGEEAHTLGVVMQQFKDRTPGFDYRIQGTDIDTKVIEKASRGIYNGRSIERFRQAKPDWFARYMIGNDTDGYKVSPEIKSKLQFTKFNLFDKPPLTPTFDLILIRNVLIYFTTEDQEIVMSTVHKRLKPEGSVIIGESESLNNINTEFEAIAPTFYQPKAQKARQAA